MDRNPEPPDAPTPPAADGAPAPPAGQRARKYIIIRKPRCPACGRARILAYRSIAAGDGSQTRYCRCADCGLPIVLIVE